ncbi:hypothetical protein [Streptomyces adelaidensis]|uniref:hypothetical protein n=1 Tax=Streptomyces adelaidensis TaxID=2796465 RepID=UPI001905414E|nr:hypothetical protein [Streptomyces adelaidensis]
MRLEQALAIGATLVALTSVTACGGDDGTEGRNGGNGGANTADATEQADKSTLPEAADMASIARFVKQYTSCESLRTGDDYDANHTGSNNSWGTEESADPSWGIRERAVCTDASGHPITLLSVHDMKSFQNSAKQAGWSFTVGSDFALILVGDEAYQAIQQSGVKKLICEPDFAPPSGFTKEPAAVDGCVLSDYFPS